MKFYLIAGERSGDLHGSNLIRALKTHYPQAVFRGFGGDYMKEAGMDIIVHYRDMSFMGFTAVLANLRTIARKMKQCQQDILSFQPDVLILIDYAGFNLRVARFAKAHHLKVFWYISPKVWAWNKKRAWKLKENVDRMFVILPFEKGFFKEYNWDVDFVGNPVLDAIRQHHPDPTFSARHGLNTNRPLVAFLPGSRAQELKRIIPLMAGVAQGFPDLQFGVAMVSNLDSSLYGPLKGLSNVHFIDNETYELLRHAQAAVVTSGTATLETALWNVPQVVVYNLSTPEFMILKRLVKVRFISLVNLIADRLVVKEMIHRDAHVDKVSGELKLLLEDQGHREKVLDGYAEIRKALDVGSASENTARLMAQYLSA